MIEHDLKQYLLETEYCDFSNHNILSLVNVFKKRYTKDQGELATALFYWVRDDIHYRVGLWNRKASETLMERSGSCTNKANLLVALFRACGIPSAYCVLRVKGRDFFGKIVLPEFRNRISENSVHIFPQVYIDGKWIKCDPSTDVYLSDKTSHINSQSMLIDWDGKSDAVLNLDSSHITDEKYLLPNIDNIISKRPRKGKWLIIEVGNLYINFLRNHGKNLSSTKDIRLMFKKWLRYSSPRYHLVYLISTIWHDIKIKLRI